MVIVLKIASFCIFRGKNPGFVTKNCSKSSYNCVFLLSTKTAQLILVIIIAQKFQRFNWLRGVQ